jgi:transposase-like protein
VDGPPGLAEEDRPMQFQPRFCPCASPECTGRTSFQYQRRGTFTRACDGRTVQRFQCKACKRTFSTQTFRVDYRLRRPALDPKVFTLLISKVTQRQIARDLKCDRRMVARRLEIFGKHCQAFHERLLFERGQARPWEGGFVFDELETYEHNRRLKPVTVPVLVHKTSHCILHTAVGTLPPRKPLSKANQRKLEKLELVEGKRRSESRAKVAECFAVLQSVCPPAAVVTIDTDEKYSYAMLLEKTFGERLVHGRTNSKVQRALWNPLFVVNHTLAMLRDGLSRLVRRNWGASKKREKLERHLWIYIAWRNYVRPITNARPLETAGMVAGLAPRMLEISELLQWRIAQPGRAQ